MTTEKKVARRKLTLLELAGQLGSPSASSGRVVSKACRIVGYSRQQFYEIRRNFQTFGADGLLDRIAGPRNPHSNRVGEDVEKAILDHCLAHPCYGAQRVAGELALGGIQVSSSGVRGVWSRHGLLGKHDRLMRLEKVSDDRVVQLNEEQLAPLERFSPEFRERHIEAHHSGDLVAVDTFFACPERSRRERDRQGLLQTAIDCCSRFAWGRLYTNKMPLTAVHLLNTDRLPGACRRVVPFFEEHGVPIKTVSSENGREFCGRPDRHPYELFLQLEGIEHRKAKVRRPQSNSIACPERSRRGERFHRTLLDEHFRVEGRRTWFETVEQMQEALDAYLLTYNTARPHQGRGMNGRTPGPRLPRPHPRKRQYPGGQRPEHRPD